MKSVVIHNFSNVPVPKPTIKKFLGIYRKYLIKRLPAKKKKKLLASSEIIIVFTTDKKMKELNNNFRKRDYVTDILSFASDDPGSLGELILAPKKVKQQARLHKLTVKDEYLYLLIHGVLHLLGYEHEESKKKAKEMFKFQDEAFESLSGRSPRVRF